MCDQMTSPQKVDFRRNETVISILEKFPDWALNDTVQQMRAFKLQVFTESSN